MECTYVYVYFALTLLELFRANETNYKNKLDRIRIQTGRRNTSWLCTSVAEELKQRLAGTNEVRRPDHSGQAYLLLFKAINTNETIHGFRYHASFEKKLTSLYNAAL